MNRTSDKTAEIRTDQPRDVSENGDLMNDATRGGPSGRTIRLVVIGFCILAWAAAMAYAFG